MNIQIYDARGDVTFKLTTKPPPLPQALEHSKTPAPSSTPAPQATFEATFGHGSASSTLSPRLLPRASIDPPSSATPASESPASSVANSNDLSGTAAPVPSLGLFGVAPPATNSSNSTETPSSSTAQPTTAFSFGTATLPPRSFRPDIADETQEVQMLASSKHLCLASPVFEAMLQLKFKEGETLRKDGNVVIPLPDDEPMVFAILMRIIHAQNDLVPTRVDIHTLTNIAVLVDKYHLHACTSIFAVMWMDALRPKISRITPNTNRNIVSWLCVAWVFSRELDFSLITLLAQKYLKCDTLRIAYGAGFDDLPTPEKVVASVEDRRRTAIQDAFTKMDHLVTRLYGPRGPTSGPSSSTHLPHRPLCPTGDADCEMILLGSLLKSAHAQFMWPIHPPPYLTDTTALLEKIRGIQIKSLCGKVTDHSSAKPETHGVFEALAEIITSLEHSHHGLELRDFQQKSVVKTSGTARKQGRRG